MTDDELSALRAAAEAVADSRAIAVAEELSVPELAAYDAACDDFETYTSPPNILRLLAHVEALTAQVAERDVLLREIADDDPPKWLARRIDELLWGER